MNAKRHFFPTPEQGAFLFCVVGVWCLGLLTLLLSVHAGMLIYMYSVLFLYMIQIFVRTRYLGISRLITSFQHAKSRVNHNGVRPIRQLVRLGPLAHKEQYRASKAMQLDAAEALVLGKVSD